MASQFTTRMLSEITSKTVSLLCKWNCRPMIMGGGMRGVWWWRHKGKEPNFDEGECDSHRVVTWRRAPSSFYNELTVLNIPPATTTHARYSNCKGYVGNRPQECLTDWLTDTHRLGCRSRCLFELGADPFIITAWDSTSKLRLQFSGSASLKSLATAPQRDVCNIASARSQHCHNNHYHQTGH